MWAALIDMRLLAEALVVLVKWLRHRDVGAAPSLLCISVRLLALATGLMFACAAIMQL